MMLSEQNMFVRMTEAGLPGLSPLIKYNPASGRKQVTKGGVSLGGPDCSARHSLNMTAGKRPLSLDPVLCITLSLCTFVN